MSFLYNNQEFTCQVCGRFVKKHPSSSRNHCPFCLHGKHVDVEPGDRLNACGGILEPRGLEIKGNKTKIFFKCKACGQTGINIAAPDDNSELMIQLSVGNTGS